MNTAISSVLIITSIDVIHQHHSDLLQFFQSLNSHQKDLIMYSPLPVTDYSKIKKIPADELIMIYKKDFFPLSLMIKPATAQILKKRHYTILIHFNPENHIQNTYLLARYIPAQLKISDNIKHSKKFPVIIHHSEKYLSDVTDYLNKLVF